MKLHKLPFSLALLAVVCLHKCCAIESSSSLNLDNDKWMKVSHNIEFQRNADLSMDSSTRDHATGDAINRMLSSQQSPTADSSYLYQPLDSSANYNEYQLAWYLYGFYVDCDTVKNYCSRYAMYAVVSVQSSSLNMNVSLLCQLSEISILPTCLFCSSISSMLT